MEKITGSELASLGAIRGLILWIHQVYIPGVQARGANDEEMPKATNALKELQSGQVTVARLEKIRSSLGNPDDKTTNYH